MKKIQRGRGLGQQKKMAEMKDECWWRMKDTEIFSLLLIFNNNNRKKKEIGVQKNNERGQGQGE